MTAPDLIGQKFGELTVEEKIGQDKHRRMMWKCRCSCGGYKIASTQDMRSGSISRCNRCSHRGNRPKTFLTYEGTTKSVVQWAETLNVPVPRLRRRIEKGLPVDLILTARKYDKRFYAGSIA